MRDRSRIVTADEVKKLLFYDSETGIFTWVRTTSNRVKVGDRAGAAMTIGYRQIMIWNHNYTEHRLAWLYMTGEWPSGEIDHINGNRCDNRWVNLRLAEHHNNMCNAVLQRNNTSGYKGIDWRKDEQVWRVRVHVNGIVIYGGRYRDLANAVMARERLAKAHHGEFYYDGVSQR